MIGDEPTWLVNLIITVALLPFLVGSLGEHVGTQTLLVAIGLLFLLVGMYTVAGGKLVDPPRPAPVSDDGPVRKTRTNPFAVHSERDEGASESTESTENESEQE